MPYASTYQPRRAGPATLGMVIALHGGAIAALMMAKMEMPPPIFYPPTTAVFVPEPVEPPPVPPDPVEAEVPAPRSSAIERVPAKVRVERDMALPRLPGLPEIPRPLPDPGIGAGAIVPKPIPMAEPVRVEATIDSRSVLLPPYPASEERAGVEGIVRVRITIGADGRVKAVERLAAVSDALFRSTERHALRAWRFKPATLDGRPVESTRVMTVKFVLRG